MTNLEELEKKLYGSSGKEEMKKRMWRRIIFRSPPHKSPRQWEDAPPKEDETPQSRLRAFTTRTLILYGLGIIFLFILIAGGFFVLFYVGTRGQEARISFDVRSTAAAGVPLTVPVLIENTSDSFLREVEFGIIFPKGALIRAGGGESLAPARLTKRIDDLEPGKKITFEYEARFFGREGEEQTIEGILLYRPESLRARFTARAQKTVTIQGVPLSVSWELPSVVARGQEIEAVVRYGSSAELPFDNLFLRLSYPSGFSFVSGDPKPHAENAIWNIGSLAPGQDGAIRFRGTITGEEGAIQTFRAGLGSFNQSAGEWKSFQESSHETRIAVVPLSIAGEWIGAGAGVVLGGETISFRARFRNNTAFLIKNVSVRVALEGKLFDLSTLSIQDGGVFDFGTQSIVWGPGSTKILKELGPAESGELRFDVQTQARPVVRGPADYNQTIRFRSSIDAATLPAELKGARVSHEDVFELKLASQVLFLARALYENTFIQNSGPYPPVAGEKTTYTIIWEMRNFTNDVDNVLVRGTLPPNIRWEGKTFPEDVRITFDPASSEVRWNIGTIPAGVGVVTSALTGAFQVSATPAPTNRGRAIGLMNESALVGRDSFTGLSFEKVQGDVHADLAVE